MRVVVHPLLHGVQQMSQTRARQQSFFGVCNACSFLPVFELYAKYISALSATPVKHGQTYRSNVSVRQHFQRRFVILSLSLYVAKVRVDVAPELPASVKPATDITDEQPKEIAPKPLYTD